MNFNEFLKDWTFCTQAISVGGHQVQNSWWSQGGGGAQSREPMLLPADEARAYVCHISESCCAPPRASLAAACHCHKQSFAICFQSFAYVSNSFLQTLVWISGEHMWLQHYIVERSYIGQQASGVEKWYHRDNFPYITIQIVSHRWNYFDMERFTRSSLISVPTLQISPSLLLGIFWQYFGSSNSICDLIWLTYFLSEHHKLIFQSLF